MITPIRGRKQVANGDLKHQIDGTLKDDNPDKGTETEFPNYTIKRFIS